jgi:dihydroxyacetone kinase-like protein
MLDAVAVGEIFTSPPANSIYEAAKAVDGGRGILFLLGNYAGDVMNFDMAAELAGSDGLEVEQVIATDDAGSAPPDRIENRRGVVGEFLAWKTCGARAEEGAILKDVKEVAVKVNNWTRTIGVALSPCTVPTLGKPTFTLEDDEIEFGVGHHGELGIKRMKMKTANEITEDLMGRLLADLPFKRGDEVVVLINGLGATPQLELYIVFKKVAEILNSEETRIYRSFIGEYFTALEMAGFSITLMKVDDELKRLIDTPTDTPCYVQRFKRNR